MKPRILAALVTLVALLITATAADHPALAPETISIPPAPTGATPGRFVLFSHAGTLYRIDTATGMTWQHEIQKTGSAKFPVVSGWVALNENFFAVSKLTADIEANQRPSK